jgi:hypothetical protein
MGAGPVVSDAVISRPMIIRLSVTLLQPFVDKLMSPHGGAGVGASVDPSDTDTHRLSAFRSIEKI